MRLSATAATGGEDGGITVSGGEPLLQIDFLVELFQKAREHGINTCIDTALAPFTHDQPFLDEFEELMGLTDLLLCDIKHIDPTKHRHLTGHDNVNIPSGLRYLSKIGKPVWIRHVLVPGITDNDDHLRRTAAFIHTLFNVERIEVFPQDMLDVYYLTFVFDLHVWCYEVSFACKKSAKGARLLPL
ncbi:radical SAM protein [Olsenella sp. Marseille-P4559]|uniref:radical SAM protein n=1 Tax=Olsenella sp. Marseille-P4559 TaxID=2364795 RepID=UPI001A917C34|nr:radical SAM protein [Olsenella sp. Marseille-P4559]